MITETKPNQLVLRWKTPNNIPFPIPTAVKIGNQTKRVEMSNGTAIVALPQDAQITVDPNGSVLKAK